MIKFYTEELDIKLKIYNKNNLKRKLKQIIEDAALRTGEINYIFCSDDYLLKINKKFLQHDYYTDIITFDNSIDSPLVAADLFISVHRVIDNARRLKINTEQELLRVMIHGLLHLVGYKDKTEQEREHMRELEDRYMSNFINLKLPSVIDY